MTDKSGITEREHLEQVERQTGRKVEALEGDVTFPTILSNVWSAFISLNNSRTFGMNGPNSISYLEIQAWMNLTDTLLNSREIELIKRLDVIYMGVANGR